MLGAMQSPSQLAASASPAAELSSFAGFLSALTSPAPSSRNNSWSDDALADDIATLSYESALKTHARYKPSPEPPPQSSSAFIPERTSPDPGNFIPMGASEPQSSASGPATRSASSTANGPGDLKSASITIRMSQAECVRLKQRATEAGMTISAYLRSCTFEAEALRGQVKEALAELRAAASVNEKQPTSPVKQRKIFDWLLRIFPRHQIQQHAQG
jgi:hypothetical protein